MAKYKTTNEIRLSVAKGEAFRERLTSELAAYTAESATRMTLASEYLDGLEDNTFGMPATELLEAMWAEQATASTSIVKARGAVEILGPIETEPNQTAQLLGKVAAIGDLLAQGPPQS